jgi:hypothetical protein
MQLASNNAQPTAAARRPTRIRELLSCKAPAMFVTFAEMRAA